MSKHNYTKYAEKPEVVEQPAVAEEQEIQVVNEEPEVVEQPVIEEEIFDEPRLVENEEDVIGVVANCKLLNVREHPGLDANVLTILYKDDEVKVYEEQSVGDFYKVETESGYEGYCVKKYIEIC